MSSSFALKIKLGNSIIAPFGIVRSSFPPMQLQSRFATSNSGQICLKQKQKNNFQCFELMKRKILKFQQFALASNKLKANDMKIYFFVFHPARGEFVDAFMSKIVRA